MDKRIMMFYDKKGDVLDISFGEPKASVSEEASEGIVIRKNPKTGKITGFTIINLSVFLKKFEKLDSGIEIKAPQPAT